MDLVKIQSMSLLSYIAVVVVVCILFRVCILCCCVRLTSGILSLERHIDQVLSL